jgi:hypothetical protein
MFVFVKSLSQKQFLIMHFVAKEEDVVEAVLEEESNVDGANSRSSCKES